MSSIINKGDSTIVTNFFGKTIEIPKDLGLTEDYFPYGTGKESLKFLAIKLKKEGYQIEAIGLGDEIECPCCGTKIQIKETTKSKKGRKKEK